MMTHSIVLLTTDKDNIRADFYASGQTMIILIIPTFFIVTFYGLVFGETRASISLRNNKNIATRENCATVSRELFSSMTNKLT